MYQFENFKMKSLEIPACSADGVSKLEIGN